LITHDHIDHTYKKLMQIPCLNVPIGTIHQQISILILRKYTYDSVDY